MSTIIRTHTRSGEVSRQPVSLPGAMLRLALVSAAGAILLLLIALPILYYLSVETGIWPYPIYSVKFSRGKISLVQTERILPNTWSGGVEVGGLTVPAAAARLHKAWNVDKRMTVTDGVRSWEVPLLALGLSVDAYQSAQLAYARGHTGPLQGRLEQLSDSLQSGLNTELVVQVDERTVRVWLETLAQQANIPPVDASVRLDGGSVVVTPAVPGFALDLEQAFMDLTTDPRAVVLTGGLRVYFRETPPLVSDVSWVAAEVERLLSSPPGVRLYDAITDENLVWTPEREVIATWLAITSTPSGPQVQLDLEQARSYLEELNASLGPERYFNVQAALNELNVAYAEGRLTEILIRHQPTRYTVQPGDTLVSIGWKVGLPYYKLLEANSGLASTPLRPGQELIVPSKDEMLPLPVVWGKRVVISIEAQRMWVYQDGERIADFTISTGIDRSPTQPGVFQIQSHAINAYAEVWDLTMPHFMGIYEAWPGFMNGIHGLPLLSNGQRLWANILGRPASYGCIILGLDDAAWLYDWAEEGVVVEIKA